MTFAARPVTLGLGALGAPAAVSPVEALQNLASDPVDRVAKYALVGAAGGALVAATVGLAGETIGPGNRIAVLLLLCIPVAGAGLGVMLAAERYRT